jgi:transposase InsO family protein
VSLALIAEAEAAGARSAKACEVLGLSVRTVERWRAGAVVDQRKGPRSTPGNKLTADERQKVLSTVNSPDLRDLSPKQIVPLLADEGRYLASESTVYRILREEDQMQHRERSAPPSRRPPAEHVADGPNQVWSWDITYLRTPVAGLFFYLYLVVDVWSRKVVAWEVHQAESADLASQLIERVCRQLGLDPSRLVLHSDNGGPMKGSTMLATLERLGILASFSRPHVSNDNPFSEALFRTLKYRPEYPSKPFADMDAARRWVEEFVLWYNTVHLHSGIRFVTPEDRHTGREEAVLARRREVYERARAARPERWSRGTRCWDPIRVVYLNPEKPNDGERTISALHGGLGAAAPSGAGQSPVKAHQNAANGNCDVALLAAARSSRKVASSKALLQPAQLKAPPEARTRRAS